MGDIYKNGTAYTYKMDKINAIDPSRRRAKSAKTLLLVYAGYFFTVLS